MFREMRRANQQLAEQECVALLRQQPRGVLAVHGEDGYPYAVPLDFLYLNGKLYFHCAKSGHKLDAISADERVSFCVMDEGVRKEGDWALHIKSVIVFGRIKKIEDPETTLNLLRQIGRKYYPTPGEAEEVAGKAAPAVQILELHIDHMTGKLVKES